MNQKVITRFIYLFPQKFASSLEASPDAQTLFLSVVGTRIEPEKGAVTSPSPAVSPCQCFEKVSPTSPFCPPSYTQEQLDNLSDLSTRNVEVTSFAHVVVQQKSSKSSATGNDELRVTCSYDYLSHYEIDPDEDVYICVINLFPIKKVVIGVSDSITFHWLQKRKFCTGLLLEVCERSVLLRTNDIFLASYPKIFLDDENFATSMYLDMHVIECCPVRQGVLTARTEMVLSYIEQDNSFDSSDFVLKTPSPSASKTKQDHYLMSDFCQPMKPPSSLDLNAKTIGVSRMMSKPKDCIIRFECVQQQVLWQKLLCRPQTKVMFDPMYVIGMSKETMLQYGFFEESLVKVSLDIQLPVLASRLALIKCLCDTIASEDKVYISPLLRFNLQNASAAMSKNVQNYIKIEV